MRDIFGEHVDPVRDRPRVRKIETRLGTDYNIKQDDVTGFWSIHAEKGLVPEHLKGVYTTYPFAKRALDLYLNNTKKL